MNFRNEMVIRNKETGDLEVIDLDTGELVQSSGKEVHSDPVFQFNYAIALEICQLVRKGYRMTQIAEMPGMPSVDIIAFWQRREKMFAEELRQAKRDRAELHYEKVLEIADQALDGVFPTQAAAASARLASDSYKWAAEKMYPERFGNKVVHEGNTEKPILMRVINTGINRQLPDVVVQSIIEKSKEVIDDAGTTDSEDESEPADSEDEI